MNKQNFGFSKTLNAEVFLYQISNNSGTVVKIVSLGAAIQTIQLPWSRHLGSKGFTNVVLGFSKVEDYETNDCYIGVAVGRVAGRISHGRFQINDKYYEITKNIGDNCLHGGSIGLSRKNWNLVSHTDDSVTLQCSSHDGEDGFPGEMRITIKYTISLDNSLAIEYEATVNDHACPINLTNHSYFNLSGIENVKNGIRDHTIEINSSKTLELDENLLPNGKVIPLPDNLNLKNNNKSLSTQLENVGKDPKGFDNYYIFDNVGLEHCQAIVTDGTTRMRVFTDQNGIQFYTSNYFNNVKCSGGITHHQHGALCLEAQNYPDAVNQSEFPCIILKPGNVYSQKTIYAFDKI